ncbi:armadillo-type protein [Infundibulicybe gibba]|nr:armadillo-type protein [Infundibulicybe gibba]
MAEVWGSVLRRMKTSAREKAVLLMMGTLDEIPDASAWSLVFACKSVSHTLHTATPSVVKPMFNYYLGCENPDPVFTLTRRVLTALIHHVNNAEQFSPIGDIVMQLFVSTLNDRDKLLTSDSQRLRRTLEIVALPCAVRQGSRLTHSQLSVLLAESMQLPLASDQHETLLKFITALLTASDMALWLSSGRGLFFLARPEWMLAEIGWGGWKLIAMPLLLKNTVSPSMLEKEPLRILHFLAALAHSNKLGSGEVDMVWASKVERWILTRLRSWKNSGAESITELRDILTLSDLLSGDVVPILIDIITTTLEESSAEINIADPVVKSLACALGICMNTLSRRERSELRDQVPLHSWVTKCVGVWCWSPDVLGGLVALCQTSQAGAFSIPLEDIYPQLQQCILSHARPLRLNALRFLSCNLVKSPPGTQEVIRRCLQGEEVSLDVQGVRDRVLRIGRVAQTLQDSDGIGADLCGRWLIAQLKVNLRPLWSPASGALALLSQRFGDLVWDLVFGELKTLAEAEDGQAIDEDPSDPWEEERSWRDPSAHKLRSVIFNWLGGDHSYADIAAQNHRDRLDKRECSSLAEKHNRELIPFFLSIGGLDIEPPIAKYKLIPWLTLFSKFSNPKALHSTDTLRTLYVTSLSHPDRSLQTIALACIFTYKSPYLSPYEDKIRILLDDTRWRDELSSLDVSTIPTEDRKALMDVVIRLLFGFMLEKRGRARGADRRAAILSSFASCTDQELGLLVDLMLRPLSSDKNSRQAEFCINTVPAAVSDKQKIGYLTLLGDVMKNLGSRLVAYWPALLGTTLDLINDAQAQITRSPPENTNEDEEQPEDLEEADDANTVPSSKKIRSIRQIGLKRFADFFRCPAKFDFTSFLPLAFDSFISPRLSALDTENTQAPSALLELFYTWTIETERVVKPHVSVLLKNLAILAERTKGVALIASPLGQRQIHILSEVAQFSTDSTQASTLLNLFAPLLRKPNKLVSEKIKVDLLKILNNLFVLITDLSDLGSTSFTTTYKLLSQLFQSLRSSPARLNLISAFNRLAEIQPSIHDLAVLVTSLNAYSTKRLNEPDFDRRLEAFSTFNEETYLTIPAFHWIPLLYNMLSFIQDAAELAVRTNASLAMKRFIDFVAIPKSPEHEDIYLKILFPALKNGLRSKNEMVRAEVLGVIAYAVDKCDHIPTLQEMKVLLSGGDEEANFFNNVHHIQTHRRSRALRRLADHCDEGHLRSNTLAEIFVPLVGNYIQSTSSIDHHLVQDAITTTGRMAKHLSWGPYYALVQKYIKLSRAKDESERVYIRTLVALLDNFHFPMEEIVPASEKPQPSDDVDDDKEEDADLPTEPSTQNTARIADAVNLRLLPNLLNHLEKRDPTTEDGTRIPVSVGIVKVAKHLPSATREPQITRLLTILSQIMRSKSQDTRDLTRDALVRIAVSLGPSYLPLILRELRAALLRGPQLHVLAHTAQALLSHITSKEHMGEFENLDDSASDVAHIAAEVIFGESGKDVQSDEFKTKMPKGLDSFAIMAKHITPNKISTLLLPLRSIIQETESEKVMQLVEETLKRVASGLNSNKYLIPSELLTLCHTLISQNAQFLKQTPARRKSHHKADALVQIKRQLASETDHYVNNSFRFVAFALRRNRFDFHDAQIINRLESMVVVVGNTLYSSSTPVLLLGLRAAAAITRCPLKSMEKSLPVFVQQVLEIIKQAGNTEAETVQIAFKSLSKILRDGPPVQVKEKDLAYLLELMSPDLEDPSRQAAVFTMLRAIVARKFVVPEIYDLMDKVSEIMVTSQSPQVQELCRGVLLQFLLDYPQGKGRLRNQMTFLAKNLSYVYESGRQSVMELLGAIITKFQENLVREYADLLFVALVMVIANDESAKCREMAAQLIKSLFLRLDETHRRTIISHLHSWASQQSQSQLCWVASQVYGFLVDAMQTGMLPYIRAIMEDLEAALARSAQQLDASELENEGSIGMEVDLDWQAPYHALTVLGKILHVFPNFTTQEESITWKLVVAHLLFPHAWVRTASCRLLGLLFTATPVAPPQTNLADNNPLSLIGMQEVAKKLCLQLKGEHLDEALGLQVVKNLFYISKCFYEMPVQEEKHAEGQGDSEHGEKETADYLGTLPWLFSKLSYQIKSAQIARRNRSSTNANWSQQPLAVLKWFAAMVSHMEPARVEPFLVHILTPVYRLGDDDTIRDPQMDELKTIAIELQDLIQEKVGPVKFSNIYNQIRQSTLSVRRERKVARAVQMTTNPEAAAKRKAHRNVIKKDSRKRKDRSFADGKGKIKRRREE